MAGEHQHHLISDLYQRRNVALSIAHSSVEELFERDFAQALLIKSIQVKVKPYGVDKTIQLLDVTVDKFFFPYDPRSDEQFIEPIKSRNEEEPLEPLPAAMDPYYPNSIGLVSDPAKFQMLYHPDKVKDDIQSKGG